MVGGALRYCFLLIDLVENDSTYKICAKSKNDFKVAEICSIIIIYNIFKFGSKKDYMELEKT